MTKERSRELQQSASHAEGPGVGRAPEHGFRQMVGVGAGLGALVLALGAAAGSLHLLTAASFGGDLADWSLPGYLGAAFGLGLVLLAGEVIFHPTTAFLIEADEPSHPIWLRFLRAFALIALGVAVILVVAWFNAG